MADKPVMHTKVVGSSSTDERDIRWADAVRLQRGAILLIAKELDLSRGETFITACSAIASLADQVDSRTELAELFEAWAETLRSDLFIHAEADGNA